VPFTQAERGDDAIDRIPNSAPALAELTIVPGSLRREFDAACLEDLEAPQVTEHASGLRVVREAMQNLADAEIQDAQPLPLRLGRAIPSVG